MLDDIEFFEQYYVGCGGFTSFNFGSTSPDHDHSHSVNELKVRVTCGRKTNTLLKVV